MTVQEITREIEVLQGNWNQVSEPHLIDYFIFEMAAMEALRNHVILQERRKVGLPIRMRDKLKGAA